MDRKELLYKFINGEIHSEELIDLVVSQSKEIERLTGIIKRNSLRTPLRLHAPHKKLCDPFLVFPSHISGIS